MKQLTILLMFLLITPIALASTNIISANTTIELDKNTAQIQSTQYLQTGEPVGNLTLILGKEPKAVKVSINGQTRNCLIQAEFARCGNVSAGEHVITISYTSTYPLARVGENTLFKFSNRLSYPTKKQRITLRLPIGTIIPREIGKDESFYISPDNAELYSDGERILLVWDETQQEVDLSVIMRDATPLPFIWIGLAGFSAIIAAASVTYILFSKTKKEKTQKKTAKKTKEEKKEPAKELLPQFIEDERKVVELLQNAPNNEAWQKTILQETKFSKAKVSRIIRNLEERGVVIKTIYGNTNKVTLKKIN